MPILLPMPYPNNAEETWLLTALTGSIIILQFHSFHVRLIVESKNRTKWEFTFSLLQTENNKDFVTIYDGPNDQSIQIKKLSEAGQLFDPQNKPSWHSSCESQSPSFSEQVLQIQNSTSPLLAVAQLTEKE